MKKFLIAIVLFSFLGASSPLIAASNFLEVSQRESKGDLIIRASLPTDLVLRSDFNIRWAHKIKYVTAEGYIGDFDLKQEIVKKDLRSAEFIIYLPLNGKYRIGLTAEVTNGGKKSLFEFSSEYTLNDSSKYTLQSIPKTALPKVEIVEPNGEDEIVQIKAGVDRTILGFESTPVFQLGDFIQLRVQEFELISSDSNSEDICQEISCSTSDVPGLKLISLTKDYYIKNRINYQESWLIVINNPSYDSRRFSFTFSKKEEVKIQAWEADRSPAPDAFDATPGLDCPYSFKGRTLTCAIKPGGSVSPKKGLPIWVEAQLQIDKISSPKYLKTIKTKIGVKSSFSFQLPDNYKKLNLVVKTLGISGDMEEQSWTLTKPLTAAQKLKSYNSGYGSLMISSYQNLRDTNFYRDTTGADGRVVRSKALIWCEQARLNQSYRGIQITSSEDWVRGCVDAAMKL